MLAGCADQTRPGSARLSLYRTAQLICERSLDANIVQLAANGGIGLTERKHCHGGPLFTSQVALI